MKFQSIKRLRLGLFFLGWVAIGLTFATQLRFFSVRARNPMSWPDVLTWEIIRWSLWFFLTPVILKLAEHFPVRGAKRWKNGLRHFFASVLVSFGHLILFSLTFFLVTRIRDAFSSNLSLIDAIGNVAQRLSEFKEEMFIIFPFIFTLSFHIGILVYWFILIFHETLAYHRRASKLESQLAQAQLEALRMQLHPHFLFNTLNSISALLHQDPKAAEEMIGGLGDFLRLTLKNSGNAEVSLKEELKFLQCYLDIETIRFGDKLSTDFNIDPDTLDAGLPNLILQPIIENAIRHGIAPKSESGRIEISAVRRDEHLVIQIKDDGPGISNFEAFREGIGLSNTRARLSQLYGSNYKFEFKSGSPGLQVDLEIPFHIL